MAFNCYMPPVGHNWGECEPCDDCTSRGLEDIRIELEKINKTLREKLVVEDKIKALQNYVNALAVTIKSAEQEEKK